MTPERWQQIEQLYLDALERVPSERAAYLAAVCTADEELKRQVEGMLAAEAQENSLLAVAALEMEARQLAAEGARQPMPTRVGHYEIHTRLGAGGMGEVFQARDTRLDRTVALKILPPEYADDKERLVRFLREAKAASTLNHPHVATIYDVGSAATATGSVHFIAMEYVEGQTLSAKIDGSPIDLAQIIGIGSQIADALAEAHGKGITHRDIKPANVMLTLRGEVKVLDFGLAKITKYQSAGSRLSTLTQTHPGVVMGTVPYMSPEQALGRAVDHRSDLFSLGVVLYEMATGRLPFTGSGQGETLDRILHSQPDAMARFNYDVPAALERIVRKCLEKERDRRYQSARELFVDLDSLRRETAAGLPPAGDATAPTKGKRAAQRAVFAVALFLLTGSSLAYFTFRPGPPPKVTGSATLVRDGRLKATNLSSSLITTLVTDGARLYFSEIVDGATRLAQVSITGGDTAFIQTPFRNTLPQDISPDKTELLVASREAEELEMPLWVLPAVGGSPRRLGNVSVQGAAYSPNGKEIAYTKGSALYRMKSDGTESHQIATVAGAAYWPRWSPDGSRLRFTVYPADSRKLALWEVRADGSNAHELLAGWNNEAVCCGAWTPDGRFYVFQATHNRTQNIWAIRESTGLFERPGPDPVQMTVGPINYRAPVLSIDGRKLFVVGEQRRGELVRYDAKTKQFANFLGGNSAETVAFSRDGEWLAYVTYPEGILWRSRVDGGDRLQLTSAPLAAYNPRWSPNGKTIVFQARMPGELSSVWLIPSSGGGLERAWPGTATQGDATWSPDGKSLIFNSRAGTVQNSTLYMLDLEARQAKPIANSAGMYSARWSPDGRYVAAIRVETLALVLYDFSTQTWRDLKTTAGFPAWSRDGKYIYFLDKGQIVRVGIGDGKLEPVVNLSGLRRASGSAGAWMGLTPDDAPMMLRDVGTQDIYALDWRAP